MRTINLKILAMVMSLLMFCSSVMPTSVSAAESLDIDYHSNHESCDSDHCEDDHGHEHENGDETVVKIAIFDTGISGTFVVGGKSFVDYTDSWADDNGHGTAMAETLVDALTVDAEIYSVKVLDSNGIGTHDDIVEALAWAVENDMDIVALSFAGKDNTAGLDAAVEYAYDNGILVIAAAGNDGSNNASFPASYAEALSVGASDVEGAVAGYSNYGDYVDVYALGTYGEQGGTSVAVQIIAAKAAAMLDADCEMSVFSLREELAGAEMKDEPECEYVSEGVVEATACAHTGKQTTKAATCTSAGYKKVTCTKCNATLSNTTIAKLGHSYKTTTTPPTCTATGKTVKKCTRCSSTTTTTIPVLGHSYTATTTAATCTADGKKVTKCSRCGVSTTSVIAKLGHSYTTTTTAATCTAEGKTVKKCNRCSSTVTTAIAKLGHDYTTTTTAATCTVDGKTVKTCSRCGTSTTTAINKLGHDYKATTTSPTCTATGKIVNKCTRCSSTTTTTIPVLGHDYIATTTAATCTADGKKVTTCSRCGVSTTTPITKLGHDYQTVIESMIIQPTCARNGEMTKKCSRCTSTCTSSIPMLDHKYVLYTQDATCTVDGCKYMECTMCMEIGTETVIPKLGHDYAEVVENVAPTCSASGKLVKKCSRCSATYTTAIPMLDHTYVLRTKAATCTEDGRNYMECTVCGDVGSESVITKLGHDYVEYISDGMKVEDCKHCDSVIITQLIGTPGSLSAKASSKSCIALSWSKVEEATEYHVYRGLTPNGSYTKIGTAYNTSYADTTPITGVLYYYKVKAYDGTNEGAFSESVCCTTELAEPIVSAYVECLDGVILTWNTIDGAKGYKVYRAQSGSDAYSLIASTYATRFEDRNVEDYACYYYKVEAYNDYGEGTSASVKAYIAHDYSTYRVVEEATCEEDGHKIRTCAKCEDILTAIIEKFGHAPSGTYTTVERATCVLDGLEELRCETCAKVLHSQPIPAFGHNFNKEGKIVQHDCKKGITEEEYQCTNAGCNTSTVEFVPIEEFLQIDTTPTLVKEGEYTCLICEKDDKYDKVDLGSVNANAFFSTPLYCDSLGNFTGSVASVNLPVEKNGEVQYLNIKCNYDFRITAGEGVTLGGGKVFCGSAGNDYEVRVCVDRLRKSKEETKYITLEIKACSGMDYSLAGSAQIIQEAEYTINDMTLEEFRESIAGIIPYIAPMHYEYFAWTCDKPATTSGMITYYNNANGIFYAVNVTLITIDGKGEESTGLKQYICSYIVLRLNATAESASVTCIGSYNMDVSNGSDGSFITCEGDNLCKYAVTSEQNIEGVFDDAVDLAISITDITTIIASGDLLGAASHVSDSIWETIMNNMYLEVCEEILDDLPSYISETEQGVEVKIECVQEAIDSVLDGDEDEVVDKLYGISKLVDTTVNSLISIEEIDEDDLLGMAEILVDQQIKGCHEVIESVDEGCLSDVVSLLNDVVVSRLTNNGYIESADNLTQEQKEMLMDEMIEKINEVECPTVSLSTAFSAICKGEASGLGSLAGELLSFLIDRGYKIIMDSKIECIPGESDSEWDAAVTVKLADSAKIENRGNMLYIGVTDAWATYYNSEGNPPRFTKITFDFKIRCGGAESVTKSYSFFPTAS